MLLLALETSTDLGSCALWRDGAVDERVCPPGRPHSETLLPLVREILAAAGVRIGDLDGIAFGNGPGAFTGLRVACGIAQGLAVGIGRPLVPVGTLAALAWQTGAGRIVALLDARMNEVYSGCFVRGADDVAPLGEIQLAPPDAVDLPAGPWHAAGNALAAYPDLAARVAAAGFTGDPGAMPAAAAVAALGAARLARGLGIDPEAAAPLYVRDKVARTVAERLADGGRA